MILIAFWMDRSLIAKIHQRLFRDVCASLMEQNWVKMSHKLHVWKELPNQVKLVISEDEP